MTRVVRICDYGGPDALRVEETEIDAPGAGEVRVRQRAIGLNYIDIYHRTGLYKLPELPAVIGMEGAGEVVAAGPGVREFAAGDRVAYADVLGAYAEERLVAADRLVKIPDAIGFETAAAVMLRGLTARYLVKETFAVGPGTVMLFHAAAGGVGLLACQWARHLGAETIIGTVGSPDKVQLAQEHGCTHVVDYQRENVVDAVHKITGGEGCAVVYDSIGRDTFPASLDCLKPRGLWVSFGNSSGPVPPFEMSILAAKGSLFATRPTVGSYIGRREDLVAGAKDLFEMIKTGALRVKVDHRYSLADAAHAHRDLEARVTTGSVVLLP